MQYLGQLRSRAGTGIQGCARWRDQVERSPVKEILSSRVQLLEDVFNKVIIAGNALLHVT